MSEVEKLMPVGQPRLVRRRVSVTLSEKDWMDLVRFVAGDLHNMEEGCPIKQQMARISDTIMSRVASLPNTEVQPR